jgi:hypothetical protein
MFAASLPLLAAANALDLTPQYADMDADGLRVRLPYFQDGAKRVFIMPPSGWKIDGSSLRAVLYSDQAPHSNVAIMLSPTPMLPTTDAEMKTVRDAVLALAGKDSENVTLESEKPDPLPINGWKTHELRIAYDISDTHYLKGMLLVRLNAREELQVLISGPAKEFPKAYSAAMTCLRSWFKK